MTTIACDVQVWTPLTDHARDRFHKAAREFVQQPHAKAEAARRHVIRADGPAT
jgi:hypothetical protein